MSPREVRPHPAVLAARAQAPDSVLLLGEQCETMGTNGGGKKAIVAELLALEPSNWGVCAKW